MSVVFFALGLSFAVLGSRRMHSAARSYEKMPDEQFFEKFYFNSSISDFVALMDVERQQIRLQKEQVADFTSPLISGIERSN